VARKKAKLPLRQGTKLPTLTEEERLQRRTQDHPLDDFPVTSRMSAWREVTQESTAPPIEIERSVERSTERSDDKPVDKQIKEAYVALDATHTASEAKIYGYLYRLSIAKGQPTCRASFAEMQDALGLAKNTLIKALRGLADKLSIDVVDRRPGSGIGSLYHIYSVKEILSRRKERSIEIDELKRVVVKRSVERSIERLIERTEIERSMVQNSNVQLNVQDATNSNALDILTPSTEKPKNLLLRNDDDNTSSSYVDDELSKLESIKAIYCDLTGNDWRDQDEEDLETIKRIPLAHIILGVCYSLDRAAGHQVNSLKYCIPSIIDHFEAMRSFPQKALIEIAYTHMMRFKQARTNEQWIKKY
jgi:hypothetical protein